MALKVPELYAVKVARTVLRGRKLPGWRMLRNSESQNRHKYGRAISEFITFDKK